MRDHAHKDIMSKSKAKNPGNKDFYRGLIFLFLSAFFIVALYCYKNYYSPKKAVSITQIKKEKNINYNNKDKKYLDTIISEKLNDDK